MARGEAGEGTTASVVVEELPKTIVRRVVKDKLSQLSKSFGKMSKSSEAEDIDMMLHKDALLAFSESARIFIHYLSATANDICKESKRQTINAEDVLKALEDMEFPEFIQPLRASLEEFRKKNAGRSAATASKGGDDEETAHKRQKSASAQDDKHNASFEENNDD